MTVSAKKMPLTEAFLIERKLKISYIKYAVRVGGGENHRFGLWDAILIKDNHINLVGVGKAVELAKKPDRFPRLQSLMQGKKSDTIFTIFLVSKR